MKNIAKHIIATVALTAGVFTLGTSAFAQNDKIKVGYDKTVSPKPDENGVYTISLEAYVTGSLTVETSPAPADIILVLDRSGSMDDDIAGKETSKPEDKRINLLRSAVQGFVETVKDSNGKIKDEDRDEHGGHRIAFVWFSEEVTNGTGLNTFIKVEDLITTTASGSGWDYNRATVKYGENDLIRYSPDAGTYTHIAMRKARDIINDESYSSTSKRSRIVVFFTDGQPGSGWYGDNWPTHRSDLDVANGCISAANEIKTSSTKPATIYSVGLFDKDEGTTDATTTYLAYTSSDYTGKTKMPTNTNDYVPVSGDKSIVVSSASALANVFASISQSAGGDYDAASSSSLLVDVVTQSFTVSTNANLKKTEVFAVPCTQQSATAIVPTFDTVKESYKLETVDSPDNIPEGKVYLGVDPETGEVKVSGFNYGAEWCGWDGKENKAHGRKLVLQIPITVNEDAVGGPSVVTNTSDSKLILKSADGEEIGSYELPKPDLKIPVSIWIEKHGLVEDDSAVFTLARAPYVKGASYDEYVTGKYKDSWESFTKIIVNEKNMQTITVDGVEHKVVKISGLDPDYYYRIKEDAWAWGYPVQIDGIQYTIGDNLKNPLQVWNQPNPDAPKHAESVVRNVFTERTTNWSE